MLRPELNPEVVTSNLPSLIVKAPDTEPRRFAPVTSIAPPLIVVPPEYELLALSVNVPVPVFVRAPAPESTPLNVVEVLLPPRVKVPVLLLSDPAPAREPKVSFPAKLITAPFDTVTAAEPVKRLADPAVIAPSVTSIAVAATVPEKVTDPAPALAKDPLPAMLLLKVPLVVWLKVNAALLVMTPCKLRVSPMIRPPEITVPPVYAFAPVSVIVPVPALVSAPPVPEIAPEKVVFALFAPTEMRLAPMAKSSPPVNAPML